MEFSKNTVSPQRVHGLLDKLSAMNKEHSAKLHPAETPAKVKEKNIEQPEPQKIKRLPKMSAAEMIARLRMGKPITELPREKIKFRRQTINRQENGRVSPNRRRPQGHDYQKLSHSKNRDVALNQIMHNLSNTRREMIENIIRHGNGDVSVENMIKNKRLIDELTGNDLERPSLTLERDREREHERTRFHIRVRQRQRTR